VEWLKVKAQTSSPQYYQKEKKEEKKKKKHIVACSKSNREPEVLEPVLPSLGGLSKVETDSILYLLSVWTDDFLPRRRRTSALVSPCHLPVAMS
jgi:hypothetical protein